MRSPLRLFAGGRPEILVTGDSAGRRRGGGDRRGRPRGQLAPPRDTDTVDLGAGQSPNAIKVGYHRAHP